MRKSYRIAAWDLSLNGTGYCDTFGETATLKFNVNDGDERLRGIFTQLATMLKNQETDLIVIEDLPRGGNPGAAKLGEVHGIAKLAIRMVSPEVPYLLVVPSTLKKFATGKGNATKTEMRLSLDALIRARGSDLASFCFGMDDNQVDAFWLRELGFHVLDDRDVGGCSLGYCPSGAVRWSK